MSATEKNAAYSCHLPPSDIIERDYNDTEENSEMSYFDQIEAKRRRLDKRSQLLVPDFLPATSFSVEGVFSSARWVLTDISKRMPPILFEDLIFLKVNRRLWDLNTVARAMKLEENSRVRIRR